jgi:hypothetical protein
MWCAHTCTPRHQPPLQQSSNINYTSEPEETSLTEISEIWQSNSDIHTHSKVILYISSPISTPYSHFLVLKSSLCPFSVSKLFMYQISFKSVQ